MIVWKWDANVRTERIEELSLARILTGHYLQAKNSDQGSPWQLEYETQSSTTHQRLAVRMSPDSPPYLKLLNNLLLARSEITCHLIITCQKCLHSVAQHNIFEFTLTPDDEDSTSLKPQHWWDQTSNQTYISEWKHMQRMKQIFEWDRPKKIPAQQLLYQWTVELPLALKLPRCATCVRWIV
jgi:hypothetical protein